MNKERRTTILILIGTLSIGLLIGLLIPGAFHKYRDRKMRGHEEHDRHEGSKKEWFAHTINRVVMPDSIQAEKITAITDWASKEIESVEVSANARMDQILDSVRTQLTPILTGEQRSRLSDFQEKAKGQWRGKGNRGR